MLTILFKLLSFLGILLLILLGIVLAVILLVLFFPVCYRISGKKTTEETWLTTRVRWLFGLLRICYDYPTPGRLQIKLLFFTLYDPQASPPEKQTQENPSQAARQTASESTRPDASEPAKDSKNPEENDKGKAPEALPQPEEASASAGNAGRLDGFISRIRQIIQNVSSKIKKLLQNIAFFKDLWNDPDTRGLLKHAGKRFGHIIKRLCPRKLTVHVTAGTGSPDTTGYLYGIYGMVLPKLGSEIVITPDFEQAILEGDFKASGHFTVAALLFHSICLLLDRRLRQLFHRIKQYQKTKKS